MVGQMMMIDKNVQPALETKYHKHDWESNRRTSKQKIAGSSPALFNSYFCFFIIAIIYNDTSR